MASKTGNSIRAEARKAFKIKGMKETLTALADIVDATSGKEAKEVFYEAGSVLGNQIRANAPIGKTGLLRRKVFVARGPVTKPNVLVIVGAPHAHLVEYGHAGPHPAPAHPFVRPAVTQSSARIQQIIRDGLGDIIERYSKG